MRAALGRILDFTVESRWRENSAENVAIPLSSKHAFVKGPPALPSPFEFGLEGEGSEPKLPRMKAAEIQPEH